MRWPFGPPHLTLKPSKIQKRTKRQKKKSKTKANAKQEIAPKTIQQQNKNKANKTETKATQKTKTNTRNTKTPKPSKPKINKNKPPHKSPPNWEKKQAFLTPWELRQTHQKQTTITLKPQKNKPNKTPFCHVQKQPTIFHKFSFFFQHTVFAFEKLCFAENTIKIVLQLVKPTFSAMSKNTFFKEKVSLLVLGNFR